MAKRVLLGIDFIGGNFPAALYTIQQWWNYINQCSGYVCVVGISNFCNRDSSLPGTSNFSPTDVLRILNSFIPDDQLVQWTSDIDAMLIDRVKANSYRSEPIYPVYPEFNYGSIDNRLLLLSYSHDCEYLVRVDPGTIPPKDEKNSVTFAELMKEHEDIIDGNRRNVVSRQYTNRPALRHMFVKNGAESSHRDLVIEYTGIKVTTQVTGGAMLTFKSPGVPAICLPAGSGLTLVWASDDGIYQVLSCSEARGHVMKHNSVERFDAVGKQKKSIEYYRGIIGAVYLKAMRDGKNENDAEQIVKTFIKNLKNGRSGILDRDKCMEIDGDPKWENTFCLEKIAPTKFLEAIAKGCNNYAILLCEWEKICELLRPSIARETNAHELLHQTFLMGH